MIELCTSAVFDIAPNQVSASLKGPHPCGTLPHALQTVAPPAGTTIAGYHELEKGGVRAGLINAVLAATQRADELSKL